MSMTSLSDLENLNVDVEVAPPADYVDGGNMLLPEGMYDLAIQTWDVSRNRDTKQPDGKAFVFTLKVVGGEHDGKTVRNLRVWTTTYQRNGATVSQLGDLIRAIDDQATWTTIQDAAAIIAKATDQGQTFRAKLKWDAFDLDWYRNEGGDTLPNKSQEQKDLRKRASVSGMVNFKQAPDGTYLPEVKSPVTDTTLEARLSIDRFVPSGKRR
jgi:hypothetical protein